ncbi:peptidoglycan recognition protein family protein [Paenibacillus thiaminolyticus]|uniref:peptidoglycan recognition protein family protein n=1 Tax=Paenibacillus thiaminolyticus TaxID=49283 RepID=UPI0027D78085|nr:peptidoglycan recognition family protein [Paenibacillus thiaminolyticus]
MSHLKVWTAARWNREIYQHLRDDEQGWHAGDDSGPGNTPSIGIELCIYQGMDEPKAWQRAAELIAMLAKQALHTDQLCCVTSPLEWEGMFEPDTAEMVGVYQTKPNFLLMGPSQVKTRLISYHMST